MPFSKHLCSVLSKFLDRYFFIAWVKTVVVLLLLDYIFLVVYQTSHGCRKNSWQKHFLYYLLFNKLITDLSVSMEGKKQTKKKILWRWDEKLNTDRVAPSLCLKVWLVLSKSSGVLRSLQSLENSVPTKPSLLIATSHCLFNSISLGILQDVEGKRQQKQ